MLSLRRGLSYCEVGDRLVFLDTLADRYFCLSPAAEAEFRDLAGGRDDERAGTGEAVGMGLLVRSAGGPPPAPCAGPRPPSRSLLDGPFPPADGTATIAAVLWLQQAKLRLRLQSLAGALAAFERAKRRSAARTGGAEDIAAIMAGFVRASLLASVGDACLSHSYAIGRRLLARQLDASLVLGVRLGPFAAHCWVQHGDWVVNDRLDMVRTFKPILVL